MRDFNEGFLRRAKPQAVSRLGSTGSVASPTTNFSSAMLLSKLAHLLCRHLALASLCRLLHLVQPLPDRLTADKVAVNLFGSHVTATLFDGPVLWPLRCCANLLFLQGGGPLSASRRSTRFWSEPAILLGALTTTLLSARLLDWISHLAERSADKMNEHYHVQAQDSRMFASRKSDMTRGKMGKCVSGVGLWGARSVRPLGAPSHFGIRTCSRRPVH